MREFFLGCEAIVGLRILPQQFPTPAPLSPNGHAQVAGVSGVACNWPRRELPPSLPDRLPFAVVPENIDKMEL